MVDEEEDIARGNEKGAERREREEGMDEGGGGGRGEDVLSVFHILPTISSSRAPRSRISRFFPQLLPALLAAI